MPSYTTSSSAQQARQHLADQLREIREDAGLTGRKLAELAGWHGVSKVSKIEHATRPISPEDLRVWCRVCEVPAHRVEELLAEQRAVAGMWTSYRRLHRSGLKRAQTVIRPVYERATLIRNYQERVVPGLLQTEGYTTTALYAARRELGLPMDDVAEAVAERMARRSVLRSGKGRYLFVIEEAVLRHRTCETAVHVGQLSHLLSVMGLPSVSLGIIPQDAPRNGVWPEEAFTMFDAEMVGVELVSGVLNITQPNEIAMYARAFKALGELAVYGDRARALITSAMEALPHP